MNQSLKLRYIFTLACIGIILYLGLGTNRSLFTIKQVHEEVSLVINEVMADNRNSVRDEDGDFEDWIEIYNYGDSAVNLKGFGLSNNIKQPFLWIFPDTILEPETFCIVWTSEKNKRATGSPLHTSFKLKSKDKAILLTSPSKGWNDIFVLEPMGENISYGRMPDGGPELYGFDEGTPGRTNNREMLIEGPNSQRLDGPLFSDNGGFYKQAFDLVLSANNMDAEIYYTLDGSVPTTESERYAKPIPIPSKANEATVVRARAYKAGYPKSGIVTQSYFVDKNIRNAYNVPVISLVTDPKNLFDYEKGIFVAGKVYDQWKIDYPIIKKQQFKPGNYSQRGRMWERDASIELYETDGRVGLAQEIAIRVSGGSSRANTIKSLSLRADNDYDDQEVFTYDFFSSSSFNEFSEVLLRASGTDSEKSFFRDAFMQSLVEELGILDTQSTRPCILYINGEYYGIRNIREVYDKSYISNHYNIKDKDVAIIKNPTGYPNAEIQEGYAGDEMHYNQMIAYLKKNDIKLDDNYQFIKAQIDIDNYIEYNVLQIYCDNSDWPGNNVSIWRKRTRKYDPYALYGHDGRWRWMVFDLDHGFGLFRGENASNDNSLERATDTNGKSWPNPPWSTYLLRTLLENNDFRNQFINTFADRLNTIYSTKAVVQKIEVMEQIYYPNVAEHIKRWNLHDNKVDNWLKEIEVMKNFAIERPENIRRHIAEYFGLRGTEKLCVEVNAGGAVKINSIEIGRTETPWEGVYFKGIPITLEAVAEPGYVFTGWQGIGEFKGKALTITLTEPRYIKATFEKGKIN